MTTFLRENISPIIEVTNKLEAANIFTRDHMGAKGLVYGDGRVFIWPMYPAGGTIEHEDAAYQIQYSKMHKNKPIFSFYWWKRYASSVENVITDSVSNSTGFWPKFLARHDDGKYTTKKAAALIESLPCDWICFSDAFVDCKTKKVTKTNSPIYDLRRFAYKQNNVNESFAFELTNMDYPFNVYLNPSKEEVDKVLSESRPVNSLAKGYLTRDGNVLLWPAVGQYTEHSDLRLKTKMKPYASKSIFNYYLISPSLFKDQVDTGYVIEASGSNSWWKSTSGGYDAGVVRVMKERYPFAEWVVFYNRIVDLKTGKIYQRGNRSYYSLEIAAIKRGETEEVEI